MFRVGALSRSLKAHDDPDWKYPLNFVGGVPIGVDVEWPRTPASIEAKTQWALGEPYHDPVHCRPNYKSLAECQDEEQARFKEESTMGWMGEIPDDLAKERFGDRWYISSRAVVDEGSKVRAVRDASNVVHLNHRIRSWTRGGTRGRGSSELSSKSVWRPAGRVSC